MYQLPFRVDLSAHPLKLINLLEKKEIKINRKILADISVNDKKAFQEIINKASG